jgi:signal transduction histidine kinase
MVWYVAAFDIEDRRSAEQLRLDERVNERTGIARDLHDTLLQSVRGIDDCRRRGFGDEEQNANGTMRRRKESR